MSKMQTQRRNQAKLARLEIVSQMFLRQYTVRQIRAEVMKRLNLSTYSTATVQNDIKTVLEELQQQRLDNAEYALQLELERIDETCRELWAQWEKSKEDYVRTMKKRKGVPQFGDEGGKSKTTQIETRESTVIGLGNVSYISEIRAQLQERRKLLGLYAPEKKEVSGELSFANLLMESGMLDEAEANSTEFPV
ncbi:hypothetical protein [uncultured Duncaniella sp.]|jgi:hypothetical protein|uniref:hypothetical protein n=1 Tax=uncultured Duncaniella sp. TaxID=2768039 RepID=UPI00272BCEAA|nr:hypothetical protein [uncultured Duncaniella sp.]